MYFAESPLLQAARLRDRAARKLIEVSDDRIERQQAYLLLLRARKLELGQSFSLPPSASLELNAWCSALVNAAGAVCPLPPASLRFYPGAEPLPVTGRPSVLTAALLQLIKNSLQYAGPRPVLELRLQTVGDCVYLLYRDSGPGLLATARSGFGFAAVSTLARQAGGTFAVRVGGPGFLCGISLPLCSHLSPVCAPLENELIEDRFSPLYLHLCPCCILPE